MTFRRPEDPSILRSIRPLVACSALSLSLAACASSVPDSGAGVGFGDYNSYMRGQSAQSAGNSWQGQPQSTTVELPSAGQPSRFSVEGASAALDRAGSGAPAPNYANSGSPVAAAPVYQAERPRGDAPATIQPQSGEVYRSANAKVSDENDFNAVSQRETIESDAQRIAQNRAQYVVVQPKELPQRAGSGPNIVQYALSTNHAPGQPMHSRGGLFGAKDQTATCGRYASADIAQQEFLAAGGPAKDKLGLDPDGDGFACSWDPRPFRKALR